MSNSIISRIIKRLKTDYFRSRYAASAKGVLQTPPVEKGSLDFTLLSMVHQRDVFSYLVAAKSFVRFTNPQRIVVVCDPSIQEADRAVLRQQIPHIKLRHADEFTHPNVPRGGTWERLFAISGYSAEGYVVQLDADTVTLRPNAAVAEGIQQKHGFVLGEIPQQKLQSLPETGAMGRRALSNNSGRPAHIQVSSEAVMDQLGLPADMQYVRGCAGFCGFPSDALMREKLIHFSTVMGAKFGERWKEWGTEQVTSNYLVASQAGTKVLPFPAYGTPDVEDQDTVFLHFIGPMRFVNSRYQQVTNQVIDSLGSARA